MGNLLNIYDGLRDLDYVIPGQRITPVMFGFEKGVGRTCDEVAIVVFNDVSTYEPEEIQTRLERLGLQHADIKHLFAFGQHYPEIAFSRYLSGSEGDRDLLVMGSSVTRQDDGVKCYPYFHQCVMSAQRMISGTWTIRASAFRLLVVRKKSIAKN